MSISDKMKHYAEICYSGKNSLTPYGILKSFIPEVEALEKENERLKAESSLRDVYFEPFNKDFVKTIIENNTMETKIIDVVIDPQYFIIKLFVENINIAKQEIENIKSKYFPAGWEIEYW